MFFSAAGYSAHADYQVLSDGQPTWLLWMIITL